MSDNPEPAELRLPPEKLDWRTLVTLSAAAQHPSGTVRLYNIGTSGRDRWTAVRVDLQDPKTDVADALTQAGVIIAEDVSDGSAKTACELDAAEFLATVC